MNDEKRPKKGHMEVSSQSLQDELVAIKERLSAIETISSISNAVVVKKYVEDSVKNEQAKKIMRACEDAKSKEELRVAGGHNSTQALDRYLQPLKQADLLWREVRDDGVVVFQWSNLFRRLSRPIIKAILADKK